MLSRRTNNLPYPGWQTGRVGGKSAAASQRDGVGLRQPVTFSIVVINIGETPIPVGSVSGRKVSSRCEDASESEIGAKGPERVAIIVGPKREGKDFAKQERQEYRSRPPPTMAERIAPKPGITITNGAVSKAVTGDTFRIAPDD